MRSLGAEPIDHTSEDLFDRVMALTDEHGADVCADMIGGEGTETIWTCMAREGRYVPVGFNDDPESGLTGRPLRKVSMGNFSVLGVMMGYNDMPVEFRRFGVNTFPPSVGREVHAALLRARQRPARSARSSAVVISMDEVAAALDDHEQRRTQRSHGRRRRQTDDRRCDTGGADRRGVAATGLDDFGPDSFREGLDVYCASVARRRSSTTSARSPCRARSSARCQPAAGRRLGRNGTRSRATSASTRRSS